jgi:hypothetical protein
LAGVTRTLLVGPVPEMQTLPPECLLRFGSRGTWKETCAVPRSVAEARRAAFMAMIGDLLRRYPGVKFIDPFDVFCDPTLCRPYSGDDVLYVDLDHLSDAGGRLLYDAHKDDFRWVFGGDDR